MLDSWLVEVRASVWISSALIPPLFVPVLNKNTSTNQKVLTGRHTYIMFFILLILPLFSQIDLSIFPPTICFVFAHKTTYCIVGTYAHTGKLVEW